jgi:hypothetical protein
MLVLPAISADQQAGQINALIPAATRNAQPAKAKDALQWNDLLKTEQAGRMRAAPEVFSFRRLSLLKTPFVSGIDP